MKRELRGAYPALLTPFKGEKLYEKGLEQLLGYCLQKGAAGFYVGGSTGEGFLMRKEERIRLLTAVKEIDQNIGIQQLIVIEILSGFAFQNRSIR